MWPEGLKEASQEGKKNNGMHRRSRRCRVCPQRLEFPEIAASLVSQASLTWSETVQNNCCESVA